VAAVVGTGTPADASASWYDVLGAELELEFEVEVATAGATLTDCWMLMVGLRNRNAFLA
jgi:hypothetical protein